LRYLVHRGYAPIPQVRSPGRVAALLVVGGEVTLFFHHRRISLKWRTLPASIADKRKNTRAKARRLHKLCGTIATLLFPKLTRDVSSGKNKYTRTTMAREHAVTARACARRGVEPHDPKAVSPKKYP